MDKTPHIVPVSELRRSAARLIEEAFRTQEPLFVTQRGYVTAVLLSREGYETVRLLHEKSIEALNPRAYLQGELERSPDIRDFDGDGFTNDW
jgi:prevent-host-death family protein